ncbi:MAG: hypothetical protein JW889_07865 [Verrucomicrobia bacterium]|nr:hypothetical protein [Verrucomicrobiota bacterium]
MNKGRIIRTAILVSGIYFVLEFLIRGTSASIDTGFFGKVTPVFTDVLIVIGIFSFGVGLVNIFMLHAHRIIRLRPNWEHSIVLFAGFFTMLTFAILRWTGPQPAPGQPYEGAGYLFDYVVTKIMIHMNSTIYSFLAFYATSAALRAFRVRGLESAVMMVSAVIVLLSMAPETSFPALSNVRDWIDAKINTAVFRALTFGMILGGITVQMRMWLGIEQGGLFKST